jgi:hypothetical protein
MPPVQLTTPMSTYGQTQLECPSRGLLLPLCLCAVRARSLCHRAEPSPPSISPYAGLCCPHAMRGYKRRPPLRVICTRAVSTSGKPSLPQPPQFSTASSVPSHLTPHLSPYASPRASPEPRATPQPDGLAPSPLLSSSAVDRAGEFHPSVARLPRCELGLSTMSGECAMGWGSLRSTPCRGLTAGEPPRVVPQHAI